MDKYHLCISTQCQVYKPTKIKNKKVQKAIEATSNLILTYENQPINAFYHGSNGGVSAIAGESWQMQDYSYFNSIIDGSKLLNKILAFTGMLYKHKNPQIKATEMNISIHAPTTQKDFGT